MDKKPKKARSSKKKDGQLERFKAKAKELGADASGEAMERAFKKIVPNKSVS
ncbi:MAG: hypothetical protein WCD70_13285 [Alphaproteobacteria bacterium]